MSATTALKHNEARIHGPAPLPIALATISNLGASFVADSHGVICARGGVGIYTFTLPDDSTDVKLFGEVEGTATTTTYQLSRALKVITLNIRTSGTLADVAATKFHLMVVRRREF